MFDFLQICLRKAKPVCKIPHMFILADVWLLPNMFGKNQTRWYIYTWVLFSTHVWILTHRYGKRHTCVQKATQLYVCKCLAFSTHVWEKPLTCLFPPELPVIWSPFYVLQHRAKSCKGVFSGVETRDSPSREGWSDSQESVDTRSYLAESDQ